MHAELVENRIVIFDSYIHKEAIKSIPGRIWDPEAKTWSIPCTEENMTLLQMLGCKLDPDQLAKVRRDQPGRGGHSEGSSPVASMPIKVMPYAHQVEAFNFVCRLFGFAEEKKGGDVHEHF